MRPVYVGCILNDSPVVLVETDVAFKFLTKTKGDKTKPISWAGRNLGPLAHSILKFQVGEALANKYYRAYAKYLYDDSEVFRRAGYLWEGGWDGRLEEYKVSLKADKVCWLIDAEDVSAWLDNEIPDSF